jgi:hypothetical protein
VEIGQEGDIALAGDFDGDGKVDAAVYRPTEGIWIVEASREGRMQFNALGETGGEPIAVDVDGDGKVEPVVARGGVWMVYRNRYVVEAMERPEIREAVLFPDDPVAH